MDKSGTGSSTTTPTTLTSPCEFNSCPSGSPATGNNATDSEEPLVLFKASHELIQLVARLNYVNAFPCATFHISSSDSIKLIHIITSVDAVRFGIQTLSPQFFGSKPDFVISGSNIGSE